jgi:hypothetical protein
LGVAGTSSDIVVVLKVWSNVMEKCDMMAGCILSSKGLKSSNNHLLTFIKSMNAVIQCMQQGNGGGVVLIDGLAECTVARNGGMA